MVPGVAQVTVNGQAKYAVRVQLNPEALASRQIGIDEVEQAIQNANVNMPMGTLYGAHKAYNIQSNGQLSDASGLSPAHRRVPQWRSGAARSGRYGRRRNSGSVRRELGQRHSGHYAGRSAPARHEHHRDRQQHPQADSAVLRAWCRRRSISRSNTIDPFRSASRLTTSSSLFCWRFFWSFLSSSFFCAIFPPR